MWRIGSEGRIAWSMPQVIAQKAAETDAMIVPWYPGIPFGPEVYLIKKKKNISISSVSISKDWLELQRPDFFEDMMMYIYIFIYLSKNCLICQR